MIYIDNILCSSSGFREHPTHGAGDDAAGVAAGALAGREVHVHAEVRPRAGGGVEARSAVEAVGAVAADQGVVARSPRQRVVPGAAVERVGDPVIRSLPTLPTTFSKPLITSPRASLPGGPARAEASDRFHRDAGPPGEAGADVGQRVHTRAAVVALELFRVRWIRLT